MVSYILDARQPHPHARSPSLQVVSYILDARQRLFPTWRVAYVGDGPARRTRADSGGGGGAGLLPLQKRQVRVLVPGAGLVP